VVVGDHNVVLVVRLVYSCLVQFRFGRNARCRLTKKAEPPPTRDVNRDSGTAMTNGGWLRRLVRPRLHHISGHLVGHIKDNEKRLLYQ
jgi:hypothetical protein